MTGPTGVGKSSLAVALAERLDGEILGADAFQIYAGLPVLTAQASPEQLAAVPHHLVGFLGLKEKFDAARYAKAAREAIAAIQSRGKLPILVGGTGLYLKALTHGLAEMPPVDPNLRVRISSLTLEAAVAELGEADFEALGKIDLKNPVRVRRALEIVLQTGRPLADSRGAWSHESQKFRGLVLVREREDLHARIEVNVAQMLASGAIEEVRQATLAGDGARRAIGFRDIEDFLAGKTSLQACRVAMATATKQYSKRQLTWCRTQFNFPTLDLTTIPHPESALSRALEILATQAP
ncbi:MAG: tRNA ((37)-N6)-dimethylallyltransferase MiaA [Verrucomicrobiota bacterium]